MEELLQRLERRIKHLIEEHDRLMHVNQVLHQGKFVLHREKESLLVKQQKAIGQIEALISKLKSLEKKNHE